MSYLFGRGVNFAVRAEEEVEGYVWDLSAGRKRGEQLVKIDDHGMDCVRYMVAYRDVVMGRQVKGSSRQGDIG